jgi:hypothetical protein
MEGQTMDQTVREATVKRTRKKGKGVFVNCSIKTKRRCSACQGKKRQTKRLRLFEEMTKVQRQRSSIRTPVLFASIVTNTLLLKGH